MTEWLWSIAAVPIGLVVATLGLAWLEHVIVDNHPTRLRRPQQPAATRHSGEIEKLRRQLAELSAGGRDKAK